MTDDFGPPNCPQCLVPMQFIYKDGSTSTYFECPECHLVEL